MKNALIFFFLMLHSSIFYAQCNYKGIPKSFLKFSIADNRPKPDKATKPKIFFDKLDFTARISAVKSGDQFYLYFHFARATSKKFEITTGDPLVLFAKSGKQISLRPAADFKGKKALTTYVIGVFYEISGDQLDILARHQVTSLKLNVSSDKKITGGINIDAGGWGSDSNGDPYYQTKIQSSGNREKLVKLAKCLKAL